MNPKEDLIERLEKILDVTYSININSDVRETIEDTIKYLKKES